MLVAFTVFLDIRMKGRSIMDMISQGVSAAKSEVNSENSNLRFYFFQVDLHMGTEIEKKVKKATSNENWGASGSEKDELGKLDLFSIWFAVIVFSSFNVSIWAV